MSATAKMPRPQPAAASSSSQPPRLDSVIGPLVQSDAAAAMGRDLEVQNRAFLETAVVSITDAGGYESAGTFLRELQTKRRQVEQFFKPMKDLAHKLHKAICQRERVLLDPLDAIDRKVRGAMLEYQREEERKRREEERRLAEEARQREEQRLLEEAAALERQGQKELAEAVVEQAAEMPTPVVVVESDVPKVAGVTTASRWTWRPINGDEARAIQLVPREYLKLDTQKLNTYARMYGASAKLPGIEFYDAGKVIVRS